MTDKLEEAWTLIQNHFAWNVRNVPAAHLLLSPTSTAPEIIPQHTEGPPVGKWVNYQSLIVHKVRTSWHLGMKGCPRLALSPGGLGRWCRSCRQAPHQHLQGQVIAGFPELFLKSLNLNQMLSLRSKSQYGVDESWSFCWSGLMQTWNLDCPDILPFKEISSLGVLIDTGETTGWPKCKILIILILQYVKKMQLSFKPVSSIYPMKTNESYWTSKQNFEINVVYKYWLSEHNLNFFELLPKFDCRDLYFEKKESGVFSFFFMIGSCCNAAFPMTVLWEGRTSDPTAHNLHTSASSPSPPPPLSSLLPFLPSPHFSSLPSSDRWGLGSLKQRGVFKGKTFFSK